MAYLGYDPDLLVSLHHALQDASDELGMLRCADPGAAEAMRVVRSCRSAIDETWSPVVGRLLCCDSLEDAIPVRLDPGDLRSVVLLGGQRSGWWVQRDPSPLVSPGHLGLLAEARAIGAGLQDETLTHELTGDELTWLTERLRAIALDPVAVAAFRAELGGTTGWVAVLERLGLDRLHQQSHLACEPDDDAATARVDQIDRALGALVSVYVSGPHTSRASVYPAVIAELDPYTAALFVTHLDLDSTAAARAAYDVISNWNDARRAVPHDRYVAGDDAPDLLFRWLADDPTAAFEFLRFTRDRPELVFRTARPDRVETLLVAGTAPPAISEHQAGIVVPPLVRWALESADRPDPQIGGGIDNLRVLIADVLAPWLLPLTSRSGQWTWNDGEADDAMRWIISDGDAANALVGHLDAVRDQLAEVPLVDADGRVNGAVLDEVSEMFSALQIALRDEEISDARRASFWLDATMIVAEVCTGLVTGSTVVGLTVNAVTAGVSPFVRSLLAEHVLPDGSSGVAAAHARYGERSADLQVAAVVAVVGQLIEMGRLPADALDSLDLSDIDDGECVPRAVDDRIGAFIEQIGHDLDPAAYSALYAVRKSFGNASSIDQQCDV
ncbi:MAG: hypothetical protein HZB15_15760 [Actinobacteria bacterium]|nr:hypothetical protein [Actinomycetota bacterium]